MKVNTRVEIISPNTVVESTDNVVVLGKDRKNIQNKMAEYNKDLADSEKMKDWITEGQSNPEFGDNKLTEKNLGGVVDVDDIKAGLKSQIFADLFNFNSSLSKEQLEKASQLVDQTDNELLSALFTLHASGHSANISHPDFSALMAEGKKWWSDFLEGNNKGDPNTYLRKNRGSISKEERSDWDKKYTTNKATELSKTGRRANPRKEVKDE